MMVLALAAFVFMPLGRRVRSVSGGNVAKIRDKEHPLQQAMQRVRQKAGVRIRPSLWLVGSEAPIAFAMSAPFGRRAVAVSVGMVRHLPPDELEWVLAHELAHLVYRDTNSATLWLVAARGMTLFEHLRYWTFYLILRLLHDMPVVRRLLTFPLSVVFSLLLWIGLIGRRTAQWVFLVFDRWASRACEYRADAYAADVIGAAPGVRVLARMGGDAEPTFGGLFATHPPIYQRVALLEAALDRRAP